MLACVCIHQFNIVCDDELIPDYSITEGLGAAYDNNFIVLGDDEGLALGMNSSSNMCLWIAGDTFIE